MQKKKNIGLLILVILLGIGILLTSGLFIFIKMKNNIPTLNPLTASKEDEPQEISEVLSYSEKKHNSFSIGNILIRQQEPEEAGENIQDMEEDIQEPEEEWEQNESSDYICSYSSIRRLNEDDLFEIYSNTYYYSIPDDKTIAQMMINEIYARHGYEFSNSNIREYFDTKEWYRNIDERNDDMDEIYHNMSEIEKDNITFLENYR